MNTNIDDLINENCDLDLDKDGIINISDNSDDSDESDDQENNLLGVVINLSHSLDRRVKCFEEYYNKKSYLQSLFFICFFIFYFFINV